MSHESLAGSPSTYRLPPAPIPEILDTPPPPALALAPDRRTLAWLGRPGLPSIAELAEPELRLAGIRINPRTGSRSRQNHLYSLAFGEIDDPAPRPASTPPDARITHPRWSPDSRHLAFAHTGAGGLELWVAEAASGRCRRLTGSHMLAVLSAPFTWMPDGRSLLVNLLPDDRGPEPPRPLHPVGPITFENIGRSTPTRTYQDLLDGPHSEELFEYHATGRLALIPLEGEPSILTGPEILSGFDPSPDGDLILVERIHRPFSYLVPCHRFPAEVRLIGRSGELARVVADLPLAESIPVLFDAVPPGPRSFQWRADRPRDLVWVEALDGGDPRTPTPKRDRVMLLRDAVGAPEPLFESEHRFAGIHWGRGDLALAYSRWWLTRAEQRLVIAPDHPGVPPRLLVERSYQDVYHDPGWPVSTRTPAGRPVLHTSADGDSILLVGEGSSPEGKHPFLDLANVATGATRRLWQCEGDAYETVSAILDAGATRILTRHETSESPPNYRIRDLVNSTITPITDLPDPAPSLAGIRRRLLRYQRDDGVELNGTLITPPGYDAGRDGPLPVLLWAYPREFRNADDAGQVDESPNRFSRPWGASHLFLLTQGYAILDGPTMPIVGEGDDEPNDSYVKQLVASAEAAVLTLVDLGVADRDRVAIGGHSYGAFTAANLLIHTDLFRAGIARSGAYNRTLTPFGFQQEQRTYWEAADAYHQMSPFTHADQLQAPLLLIHGEADDNSGTHPLQSERFYHALRGHGATVRYVVLPHESHGYRARESVLHTLAEMIDWLNRWLVRPDPATEQG